MASRREVLAGLLAAAAQPAAASPSDRPGEPLSPWRPGQTDIHHIATGRGDSALIVGPDGRTLLIDAGASASPPASSTPARPDASRNPGAWIGRYVRRRLADTGGSQLDVAVATHIHPDHIGDPAVGAADPRGYVRTGLSEVAELVPIGLIVDRGAPAYEVPAVGSDPTWANHRRFVADRLRAGGRVEAVRVGDTGQFGPARDGFEVRPLIANGRVWSGRGLETRDLFADRPAGGPLDENPCSIGLRLIHGRFRYFTGGDLVSYTGDGATPWRDVETAAARACGPVDVAVAPHHGMFDAVGADMARALRPRVWVIQAWHAAHPGMLQLERMFSAHLYPGPREVFATGLTDASRLTNDRLVRRMAASDGHVVVRVAEGGGSYRVIVTSNRDEADRVVAVFGPFASSSAVSAPSSPRAPTPDRSPEGG
ncbi:MULTISPECIES: ComEC/Rec2 family competence protein [unclassified Phenylobacterium]|uniref:ComEC/Rec2 family competence protein n=1 Tax=unclassified Phenylobacterium TaxID=2640670 RepID=UPI000AF069ED|nr:MULTISPECIES: MBL fold metallo-hydrolase [unclassified Phenylobacterium]